MTPQERKQRRSEYFKELQSKRKNPYLHFKDSETAKEAQLLSAKSRKRNAKAKREAKKNS